ncbi:uncharacterized protein LOC110867101 [Helianthus annuus]|uniref:uncharacterized protein LOC110867101 n=1 Tax=Helianthus annuus TaxID=4232 RepID=UPI000B8FF781|nr:uncharacterized protein LOC110867101 [Helianthus annuus]
MYLQTTRRQMIRATLPIAGSERERGSGISSDTERETERLKDTWTWNDVPLQHLAVHDTKKWVTRDEVEEANDYHTWCKWVPSKCNIFMWRISLDRIPTKQALSRRNIWVGDLKCSLCEDGEETTDHVFTSCPVADGVWSGIAHWCHLPPIFLFSVKDIQSLADQTRFRAGKKDLLLGIFILTCWRLWKARNEKVFKAAKVQICNIIADVKSLSFLWFNSRAKKDRVEWKEWNRFAFDVTYRFLFCVPRLSPSWR